MTSEDIERKPIRAHVVLKGREGSLSADRPVTAENIAAYTSDPLVRERIRETLERLGFAIVRVSPFSITVEALPSRYESVFRGHLEKAAPARARGGEKGCERTAVSGAPEAWTWAAPPAIPEELRDSVDAIVFPQPTKLML